MRGSRGRSLLLKGEKDEANVPFRGKEGDSELREREEPWARRGAATSLQKMESERGSSGEKSNDTVLSLGWRGELKERMTGGLCSLCEVEPRAGEAG